MQTPPEIVLEGLPASPQIKDAIGAHLAELEKRWGRIIACRIVVKGPGQRQRKGGLYDVRIRLALPDGREVNVTRTPPADERHSDLTFAVDDAFNTLGDNFRMKFGACRVISSFTKILPQQPSRGSTLQAILDFSRPKMVSKYTFTAIA